MKILVVHNEYQFGGGEDTTFTQEVDLLRQNGHEVVTYKRSNKEIINTSLFKKMLMPIMMIWSRRTAVELQKIITTFKPDVAHFHNTFYMISPAAYYACKKNRVPIIQSMHNVRWFCINGIFFRDSDICLKCYKKIPWYGINYKCYRNSRLFSIAVFSMIMIHRVLNTWNKEISAYITFSEFHKKILIDHGIDERKIVIKQHFTYSDPNQDQDRANHGNYAIFIGRLEQSKGIITLLNAWKKFPNMQLKIYGTGLLKNEVDSYIKVNHLRSIQQFGHVDKKTLFNSLKYAKFLIFPSEWYETFGLTIIEAFAHGVPVIASRLGCVPEIVDDYSTGILFNAGDADDLVSKIEWANSHSDEMSQMGIKARIKCLKKYSAITNYTMLMEIYQKAIKSESIS